MNKTLGKNNTSGFRGVVYNGASGKWRAQIYRNRKHIHLGFFDTPELAHLAYCQAALELHGEFTPQEVNDLFGGA